MFTHILPVNKFVFTINRCIFHFVFIGITHQDLQDCFRLLEFEACLGFWGQSLWDFLLWVELPHHLQFFPPRVTMEFAGAAVISWADMSGTVWQSFPSLIAFSAMTIASSTEMPASSSSSPYVCLIWQFFTYFFLEDKKIYISPPVRV